jgi:hypothetical protein
MAGTGLLGRKHFILDKQRAFIRGHGEQALVFPCLQCPCLLADRQFDPNCHTCKGTGRFYPPNTVYATWFPMVREHSKRSYNDPGTWMPGTIQVTTLPGVRLSERDKVRRLDITETFNDEVLTRGLDDTVRFPAGVTLELVADRERVYQPGHDYVLTPPATVTWVAGGQTPAFMQQYSVKYSAQPEYLCTPDNPRSRVEHQIPQSQVVMLTRLDYVVEGGL